MKYKSLKLIFRISSRIKFSVFVGFQAKLITESCLTRRCVSENYYFQVEIRHISNLQKILGLYLASFFLNYSSYLL